MTSRLSPGEAGWTCLDHHDHSEQLRDGKTTYVADSAVTTVALPGRCREGECFLKILNFVYCW